MTIIIKMIAWCVVLYSYQGVAAFAQDAILPQGDSGLQSTEEKAAQQEAVRDSRLKQQGQGSNYRVEGKPQPGDSGETQADGREDTGLADPTVNPGQASGMQNVQGRIVKSDGDTYTIQQLSGPAVTVTVDDDTVGQAKLFPGDVVSGVITPQGRAVAIHKESGK